MNKNTENLVKTLDKKAVNILIYGSVYKEKFGFKGLALPFVPKSCAVREEFLINVKRKKF